MRSRVLFTVILWPASKSKRGPASAGNIPRIAKAVNILDKYHKYPLKVSGSRNERTRHSLADYGAHFVGLLSRAPSLDAWDRAWRVSRAAGPDSQRQKAGTIVRSSVSAIRPRTKKLLKTRLCTKQTVENQRGQMG